MEQLLYHLLKVVGPFKASPPSVWSSGKPGNAGVRSTFTRVVGAHVFESSSWRISVLFKGVPSVMQVRFTCASGLA